jgi:hypothetical protein
MRKRECECVIKSHFRPKFYRFCGGIFHTVNNFENRDINTTIIKTFQTENFLILNVKKDQWKTRYFFSRNIPLIISAKIKQWIERRSNLKKVLFLRKCLQEVLCSFCRDTKSCYLSVAKTALSFGVIQPLV